MKKVETVVILVNYNNDDDTAMCIKSVCQAEGNTPVIIVVDNASDNVERLKEIEASKENVHLILNDENIGFGRANNIGINWANEHVDYDYLLLLNNDTTVDSKYLIELQYAIKEDPFIGIVTSKIMYQDRKEIVWYGGGEINIKRGRPIITDFNQKPTDFGAEKAKYVSFISGCVMLFTKKSIKEIGGFDDAFFMYAEDMELCLRAKSLGYKLFYQPKSIVYHKVQGSNRATNKITGLRAKNPNLRFLFLNMKSNQYLAMRKHLSLKEFNKFKLNYWFEYFYICVRLFFGGRFDIFSISRETIKRIKKFKKTC